MQRRKDEMMEEITRHKKERENLSFRLEDNAHRYKIDLSDLKSTLLKENNTTKNLCEDYKSKLTQVGNELKMVQVENQELKEKCASIDRNCQDQLRMVRDEENAKSSHLQLELQQIEKQYTDLKQQSHEKQVRYDSLENELCSQIESLKRDYQNSVARIDQLNSMNQTLQSDKDLMTVNSSKLKDKMDQVLEKLAETSSLYDKCKHDLVDSNTKLDSTHLKSLNQEKQIQMLQDQLSRETEAFEHTLERQHMKNSQENQQLTQKLDHLMQERVKFMQRLETTEQLLQKVL